MRIIFKKIEASFCEEAYRREKTSRLGRELSEGDSPRQGEILWTRLNLIGHLIKFCETMSDYQLSMSNEQLSKIVEGQIGIVYW